MNRTAAVAAAATVTDWAPRNWTPRPASSASVSWSSRSQWAPVTPRGSPVISVTIIPTTITVRSHRRTIWRRGSVSSCIRESLTEAPSPLDAFRGRIWGGTP